MRFTQYLINEGRSKPISKDDAIDYINRYCSKFKYGYENDTLPVLYRGLSNPTPYLQIDPRKGSRVASSNNHNYTTLMIDNFKSWKKYPKRSKSVICSTDEWYVPMFGSHTFKVYPSDKCTLGIVGQSDIWSGFQKTLGIKNGLPDLHRELETMIVKLGGGGGRMDKNFKM